MSSYSYEIQEYRERIRQLEGKIASLEKRLEMIPSDNQAWNEKSQIILEFIKTNPGTNKQAVIEKLTSEKKGSRVTILDEIANLIDSGFITARKSEKSASSYKLFINEIELESLLDFHEKFENSFVRLIEKIRPHLIKDELQSVPLTQDHEKLMFIHEILMIYVHFLAMIMIHAIFTWPKVIKDDEKRIKLNAILFSKLQKLHSSISNTLTFSSEKYEGKFSIPIEQNTILHWFKLTPSLLKLFNDSARKFGFMTELEDVLDISWNVSYNLLPFARPLFEKEGHKEGHDIQKWNNPKWRPISWKEALKYYEKGFLESDLNLVIKKAMDLFEGGNVEEALEQCKKVLSLDSENLSALNNIGYILNSIGRYNEAIIYLDKALSIDPEYEVALVNKGNSIASIGNHNEAIHYYDVVLRSNDKNFNALNNKGHELLLLNESYNAQRYFDRALKVEPTNPLVLYNMGLLYEQKQDYKNALLWFNKLLEVKPDHVEALVKKGRALCEMDKDEEAVPIYQKILELDPDNVDGLNNKGVYLIENSKHEKDFEKALRCFDKALSNNPEHFEALNNKAATILRFRHADQDYKEALDCFDKAISVRPHDSGVIINKGILFHLWKKYDEAIKCFDTVLVNNPKDTNALLYKAEALLEYGNNVEAIQCVEQLLSIEPNNSRAKDVRKKLVHSTK